MNRALMLVVPCIAAVVLLQGQTKIRQTPIQPTSPASGQEMFMAYCASCHGKDAKGAGPAAPALKTKPSDLTLLSRTNGGTFPGNAVYVAIGGTFDMPAHGSGEMPVWGHVFTRSGNESQAKLRLSNLTAYVRSIQAR
jgi:mono/diheme cytochrome c family protein